MYHRQQERSKVSHLVSSILTKMKKEHVELVVRARKWQNEITNRHNRRNRRQSTTAQEPLNTIAALWSDIVAGTVTSDHYAKIVKIR